ncbi:uncharacterized protein SAPINGB_P003939 [Magnusiomyces paraingens]|uniref:Phosphoglycerate mutase-like protein n=1 Tax=Magnusiomyces paraingens TaxID=2606893 RepID=A0A5E8BZD2_9ASCO|nr:uncharacterized protein SAPINGB_P003939 [Saprochaete ingens]VVT54165.1 unnamed protein product [Saprochaete ingens]
MTASSADPTSVPRTLKVLIVRHGQTDHNIRRILQGHLNTRLNEQGRSQATLLGKYWAAPATSQNIDAVFSSDLQRCITTNNLILTELGLVAPADDDSDKSTINPDINTHKYAVPVTFTSNLRERDLGPLQSMYVKEAHAKAASEGKSFVDYGESMKSVRGRLRLVWADLIDTARKNPDISTIMIVSHGGAISKLCADLVNTGSVRIADEVPVESIAVPPNTSVTTLLIPLDLDEDPEKNDLKEGKVHKQGKLADFGNTEHLKVPVTTYQDEQ